MAEAEAVMMDGLQVGDRVRKIKGYPFISTVVAIFPKLDGRTRLVCESEQINGLLHIFSPEQMELIDGDQFDCPNCGAAPPTFHRFNGHFEMACNHCGWTSIGEDVGLMTRREYLLLNEVMAGTKSQVAIEAVAHSELAHPEWDMQELKSLREWETQK